MRGEEIKRRVEIIKNFLKEFYEDGVITAQDYNELWPKISDIKYYQESK